MTTVKSVKPKPKSSIVRWLQLDLNRASTTKLFYGSLILLVAAIVLLGAAVIVQTNTPKTARIATPTAGHPVGPALTQGAATLAVTKVSKSYGQPGFMAPAGQEYLIITLRVKNNSEQPIDVLPSTDTYLKDGDGRVVYLTPYGLSNPFRAGKLLPGEQVQGELSYIASKTGHYKLYVDGIWSGGVVPFAVQ